MTSTAADVLAFVEENDIKFIRLAFCDPFGFMKNISIMPQELRRAFEGQVSFDAFAIRGFQGVESSDLFLQPDAGTLHILPWRPQTGRVARFYCDVFTPQGEPFAKDCRGMLKRAVERAAALGYCCRVGLECEFYLFKTDEQGNPTHAPLDRGSYFDIAPLDRGENVRRQICLTLDEMGIRPESSHHEQGPGQNEIDFHYSDPLTAADSLMTFKAVVKAIAASNGLYASFMPKPMMGESGSGLHINLSLVKDGKNIFRTGVEEGHCAEAEHFMAGVLAYTPEITAFLNPLTNSYARFGEFEAPRYTTWSHQNRSQLIRIPAGKKEFNRMELRSPDPACNPYLALTLILEAGLDGMEREMALCPPTNRDMFEVAAGEDQAEYARLPDSLEEALNRAQDSPFVRRVLPEEFLSSYLRCKREEMQEIGRMANRPQAEAAMYFERI